MGATLSKVTNRLCVMLLLLAADWLPSWLLGRRERERCRGCGCVLTRAIETTRCGSLAARQGRARQARIQLPAFNNHNKSRSAHLEDTLPVCCWPLVAAGAERATNRWADSRPARTLLPPTGCSLGLGRARRKHSSFTSKYLPCPPLICIARRRLSPTRHESPQSDSEQERVRRAGFRANLSAANELAGKVRILAPNQRRETLDLMICKQLRSGANIVCRARAPANDQSMTQAHISISGVTGEARSGQAGQRAAWAPPHCGGRRARRRRAAEWRARLIARPKIKAGARKWSLFSPSRPPS